MANTPPEHQHAHRLPIVVSVAECGQENPARRLNIETGIKPQPISHMALRPIDEAGDPGHPPAVDLQGTEIMSAVRVAHLGTDRASLLIPQPQSVRSGQALPRAA